MCGDLLTQLSSLQQTPIFLNECEGTTKVLKRKATKSRDAGTCVLHRSLLITNSDFEVRITLPQCTRITKSCSRTDVEFKSGDVVEPGSRRPTLC